MGDSLVLARRHPWRVALPVMALLATSVPVVVTLTATTAPPVLAAPPAGGTTLASPRLPADTVTSGRTPAISADGAWTAFVTDDALTPDDTNTVADVYVQATAGATLVLVSRPSTGSTVLAAPSNGGSDGDGSSGYRGRDWDPPAVSPDGRFVAFVSTEPKADLDGDGAITDDDQTLTGSFRQVWLVDRDPLGNGFDGADREVQLVSALLSLEAAKNSCDPVPGDGDSRSPTIGVLPGEGQRPVVAFASTAHNLLARHLDDCSVAEAVDPGAAQQIYRWVGVGGASAIELVSTRIVDVDSDGAPLYALPDGDSFAPAITANGDVVTFASDATNLVDDQPGWGGTGDAATDPQQPDDTNLTTDVFVAFGVSTGSLTADTPTLVLDGGTTPAGITAGSTAGAVATFRNSGRVPVRIGDATLAGEAPDQFLVGTDEAEGNGCSGQVLLPGDRCDVDVLFAPTDIGTFTATLGLEVLGSTAPPAPVALVGDANGTSVANASFGLRPGIEPDLAAPGAIAQPGEPYRGLSLASRIWRCIDGGLGSSDPGDACDDDVNQQGTWPALEPAVTLSSTRVKSGEVSVDLNLASIAFTSASTFWPLAAPDGPEQVYTTELIVGANGDFVDGGDTFPFRREFLPAASWVVDTSAATPVTLGDRPSGAPSFAPFSARRLAFRTSATNLVDTAGGDTHVVALDRDVDTDGNVPGFYTTRPSIFEGVLEPTELVLVSREGTDPGNDASFSPSLSVSAGTSFGGDVVRAAFGTRATNLDPPDGNQGAVDVMTARLIPGPLGTNVTLQRVTGIGATRPADDSSISADGRYVAFASASADLVANDTNGTFDVTLPAPAAATALIRIA